MLIYKERTQYTKSTTQIQVTLLSLVHEVVCCWEASLFLGSLLMP